MAVISHGIDLVECQRVEKLLGHYEQKALNRLFTKKEQDYCQKYRNAVERFSGRFAVKEAVMKALGTGWSQNVHWTDIETVNQESGQPEIRLYGGAALLASQMGIAKFFVSITHANGMAMASVIAVSEEEGAH